ncbi:aldehyde dehydrogenase family protein [Burkholderia multivorans]|uniref:aldehyde dehydrogenase family protein n=1 Tax=Burkholderia multivorans TaxID=87883 RepID=UPI001C21EB24|nr:aldehyde dehydrogenase family protein [Burkholderia multivorans]MBU9224632.1 aldehyde dehydrogenase family protein [Burkholderia multivorans]MBU9418093.1 aldehyde dehydrogenase family protein [Burkholderia multivorans]
MAIVTTLPEVERFLAREHGHFLDGRTVMGRGQDRIDVRNPATGARIASVATADDAEIELAIASSHRAFSEEWANTSAAERERVLLRFADLIEAHGEEIAQIETAQSGKLIGLSRAIEVGWSARWLRYYAGWATKIAGETLSPSYPRMNGERYTSFTRREPLGVVFGIIPWNFPVMIPVWKFGAALATGNTVLLKSSEFTPLALLRVAELGSEAGLPPGALNVINGPGHIGTQIIADRRIPKVSFTGSVRTGKLVGREAAESNLTRVTLELGGKNAAAFLPDTSVDKILEGVVEAGFLHSGQVCAAAERFFVHRSQIHEVIDKLKTRLASFAPSDPMDDAGIVGPVSNEPQFHKCLDAFSRARQQGDEIVVGGEAYRRDGFYIQPTIIVPQSLESSSYRDEIFGPVGTFVAYDDEDELISKINDTPFGLTASLWTNDLSKALRLVPHIEAGTVWINMHTQVDPAVPFGGAKGSGVGREYGSAFIDAYTELKSVTIRY